MRAAQGQATDHDLPKHGLMEHDLAKRGFAAFAERAAATLFFTFFPADCRICGSPLLRVARLPVCESCVIGLRPLKGSHCTVCGEALHLAAYHLSPNNHHDSIDHDRFDHDSIDRDEDGDDSDRLEADRIAAACMESRCLLCQRADPPFERAVAYGSYDGGLRDLIHVLKFQQVRPAAAVLGRLLAEAIANLEQAMPVGKIMVVPVPLHRRKQVQRGFNQAEVIARCALNELSRPKRFEMCGAVLLRRRETGSQIGLTSHQRRENLRGAFAVSDPTRILKRDVLLVDDVFTTGTTASECARVLLRAGAARVWVATVARTLKLKASGFIALPEDLREDRSEEWSEGQNEERLGMAAEG
jgi:ComF family protein